MASPILEAGMRGKSGEIGWSSKRADMMKYLEALVILVYTC